LVYPALSLALLRDWPGYGLAVLMVVDTNVMAWCFVVGRDIDFAAQSKPKSIACGPEAHVEPVDGLKEQ